MRQLIKRHVVFWVGFLLQQLLKSVSVTLLKEQSVVLGEETLSEENNSLCFND